MTIKDAEEFVRSLFASPLKTAGLLLIILIAVAGGAWLVAVMTGVGEKLVQQRGTLELVSLVVGEDSDSVNIDATFSNQTSQDAIIDRIGLQASFDGGAACCCPPTETLTLTGAVQVEGENEVRTQFNTTTGGETRYEATGQFQDSNCDSHFIDFSFPISYTLAKQGTGRLRISVPRSFAVTRYEISGDDATDRENREFRTPASRARDTRQFVISLRDYHSVVIQANAQQGDSRQTFMTRSIAVGSPRRH